MELRGFAWTAAKCSHPCIYTINSPTQTHTHAFIQEPSHPCTINSLHKHTHTLTHTHSPNVTYDYIFGYLLGILSVSL